MKILQSWLQDYINIKDLSTEQIADRLSMSGSSVEEVIYNLDNKVIVVEIKKIEPHPNADRLRLATVFTGTGELTVVCGAPNIEIGQKVPLAQLGSILPGDFEIKKANIRGVESEGMLCAEDELGLGQSHDGIIILPNEYTIGTPLNKYIQSDAVFDIEITPNRGDCLSHLGIAREIAALFSLELVKQDYPEITKDNEVKITVENPEYCPRYFGTVIKGVKIGPSPEWLQERLKALGAKPINNVVDVTNYIMLNQGQPLHAFDLNKIDGGILVRIAKDDEKFTTLDNIERKLPCDALLICDHQKPIALAGIMGGLNSEITDDTVDVFLESAEFERKNIRKTSKLLNLSTDASYRYERGIDSNNVPFAMKKAANLIVEVAGGTITGQNSDEIALEEVKLPIPYEKINNLLGLVLDTSQIDQILLSLGFKVENGEAVAPSWRHDIGIWQDLAEEVGRIYGYDKITPITLETGNKPAKSDYYKKAYIKNLLTEAGFNESLSYAFLSEKDLEAAKLEAKNLLEVANPIQPENKYLRSSLVPNILKAVAKNPSFDQIFLFEIGEVFNLDNEKTNLSVIASGKYAKQAIEKAKNALVDQIGVKSEDIGIKELSRDELSRYKIKKPVVYYFELSLSDQLPTLDFSSDKLDLIIAAKPVHYRSISRYPSLTRDLAFIVDKDIDPQAIVEVIYEESELVARVELFDEFASDKFGENKKNVAYHLSLQHIDRTLTDKEADEAIANIVKTVQDKFDAKLRS